MKKKRRTIELAQQTAEMFARCVAVLKPPPELTLSQWADTYRMLSAENSATPGRWHTDNAPYQREIMDAIGDQHVRKVVVMSAAQIGKTAMLMNSPTDCHSHGMRRRLRGSPAPSKPAWPGG